MESGRDEDMPGGKVIRQRNVKRIGNVVYACVLCMMSIVAVVSVYKIVSPMNRQAVPVDTKLKSGWHLTFVFLSPTSMVEDDYASAIHSARDQMRKTAAESGFYFSTVGVSDHWEINSGMRILTFFGNFDEVVIGRNWFNSGVKRYVTDLEGPDAVPQVVIVLQHVDISARPFSYSDPKVIYRAVGFSELLKWEKTGFSLPDVMADNKESGD